MSATLLDDQTLWKILNRVNNTSLNGYWCT